MKRQLQHIIIGIMLLFPLLGVSQTKDLKNDIIQQRIEFIAQQYESSTIDFSNLIEILTYYFEHPLNLNTATPQDLEELNLMTSFQIRSLITYRVQKGDFITIYELRNIEGFDYITLQNIVPFVTVAPNKKLGQFNIKKSLKFGRQEILMLWGRIAETQDGYSQQQNSRYFGNPNRMYLRYRFKHSTKLSFGFTADQDPGEAFFTAYNKKGFDFYSAHLYATDIGIIKQLAIGDFHAQFGQGLTFWSGFSYKKTADALNVVRFGRKLTPYASRNENNFMRGAGTTIAINDFELTTFYSRKNIDANLANIDTLNNIDKTITSFQESGLHRTQTEVSNKHSINEQIIGANIGWRKKFIKLGSRIIHSKYSGDLDLNSKLSQKFLIDTNQWYNIGLDANILLKNIHLFGEVSSSSNGGWAYLAGAILKLDDRLSLSIINRNFQPNYLSIHANSFGERSSNNNEVGTYIGLKADIVNGVVFTGYIDKYQFNWLSYQADGPTSGLDFMARLQWSISRKLDVYTRFRKETQQKNSSLDTPIHSLVNISRSFLRFHLRYSASSKLKFNSRIELSNSIYTENQNGKGFVIYQDFQVKFMGQKSTITGRVAMFDVNDYNARIYSYENDVLYYFSIPAYYNRGTRTFLVYHYKPNQWFDFWLKISKTFVSNKSTIGTGAELIQSPHKTEIRAQVRFKF